MKGLLSLLRHSHGHDGDAPGQARESAFFTTAFALQGAGPAQLIPWEARAVETGARRLPRARCARQLQELWAKDRFMAHLAPESIERMARFFQFATIPPGRDVIRQGEYGNFMVVLLSGAIAVDRIQPWGEHLRLAETRPGDILGEMSLLDSGIRFSACTTLTDAEVAVLGAEHLDEMMEQSPALAASLVALLARKLSLRLRSVSARLSEHRA